MWTTILTGVAGLILGALLGLLFGIIRSRQVIDEWNTAWTQFEEMSERMRDDGK